MRYDVVLSDEAARDYKRLDARDRAKVRDGMEIHLRFEPSKLSKSRIKRLRGMRKPQFRLRIDEIRVFYDISDGTVEVHAILPKSRAASWLASVGEPE
jgi:mRNA-degrading endonuclease RelE of RelBE toxin-antitoxin system